MKSPAVRLRDEMSAWLKQSRRLDPPAVQGGGEDEANYALAWIPHYLLTRDPAVMEHFRHLRDELLAWIERDCVDGYEPEAEAHHGTEPFVLFLPRYLALTDDPEAAQALLNAARHLIDRVPGVPTWYEREHQRFRSYWLGTRRVREEPNDLYESTDHLRFLHLALAAYRVSEREAYLSWALAYGRIWADRILGAGEPMPLVWDHDGRGLREADIDPGETLPSALHHHATGDPLGGIENLLASGAVDLFGDLFELTGDDHFRAAARAVVEPLVDHLLDPYADPAAAAVRQYRLACADSSLDDRIAAAADGVPAEQPGELVMMIREVQQRDDPGVGRRKDMLRWGHRRDDDTVVPSDEPSTAALTLFWDVTGRREQAERALSTAARKLSLARRVLRGGREHADMGGAVCAVAAGHGRNWGTGAVTGCYGPLLLGARLRCGEVVTALESEDREKLPLVRCSPAGPEIVAGLERMSGEAGGA